MWEPRLLPRPMPGYRPGEGDFMFTIAGNR